MDATWRAATWSQLGAAIDTLDDAINACPDALWADESKLPPFWYFAYHALFWLDLHLSGSIHGFAPPEPFTLDELDPNEVLPERPYAKAELSVYLQHCRAKAHATIDALADARAATVCDMGPRQLPFAELLLYTMRHVQEHAAQLSLLLSEATGSGPGWVGTARRLPHG
jgi:hypothetical protein